MPSLALRNQNGNFGRRCLTCQKQSNDKTNAKIGAINRAKTIAKRIKKRENAEHVNLSQAHPKTTTSN